jgi:hypothetical protein
VFPDREVVNPEVVGCVTSTAVRHHRPSQFSPGIGNGSSPEQTRCGPTCLLSVNIRAMGPFSKAAAAGRPVCMALWLGVEGFPQPHTVAPSHTKPLLLIKLGRKVIHPSLEDKACQCRESRTARETHEVTRAMLNACTEFGRLCSMSQERFLYQIDPTSWGRGHAWVCLDERTETRQVLVFWGWSAGALTPPKRVLYGWLGEGSLQGSILLPCSGIWGYHTTCRPMQQQATAVLASSY